MSKPASASSTSGAGLPPAGGVRPPDGSPGTPPPIRVVDKRWWARGSDEAEGEERRSDKPTYVEDIERQLAEKDARLKEYADRFKQAANDFEQTRDRLRREMAKDVEREKRGILGAFLEVVDNLDRAIAAGRDGAAAEDTTDALLQGVALVRNQFLAMLGRYEVTQIAAAGQAFDPTAHEALSTVPVADLKQENIVVTVVKPGYLIGEDVLRPASVTVGKLERETAAGAER